MKKLSLAIALCSLSVFGFAQQNNHLAYNVEMNAPMGEGKMNFCDVHLNFTDDIVVMKVELSKEMQAFAEMAEGGISGEIMTAWFDIKQGEYLMLNHQKERFTQINKADFDAQCLEMKEDLRLKMESFEAEYDALPEEEKANLEGLKPLDPENLDFGITRAGVAEVNGITCETFTGELSGLLGTDQSALIAIGKPADLGLSSRTESSLVSLSNFFHSEDFPLTDIVASIFALRGPDGDVIAGVPVSIQFGDGDEKSVTLSLKEWDEQPAVAVPEVPVNYTERPFKIK